MDCAPRDTTNDWGLVITVEGEVEAVAPLLIGADMLAEVDASVGDGCGWNSVGITG